MCVSVWLFHFPESCFSFVYVLSTKMLFAKRRHRKRKNKSKINSSVIVHSDDILLFDLMYQCIGGYCLSALTYAIVDSSIVVVQATTTKPQTIDKSEKPVRKIERKNSILWLMVQATKRRDGKEIEKKKLPKRQFNW